MIDVQNLTKRYGSHLAVDDVSFRCEPGTITGFLGPNGAGKSTTLRMMMGLTPPTSGRATVGGVPFAELPNPGRVVGVMLDASAQHAGRSGLEVLRLSAQLLEVPRSRVEAVLEGVGLGAAGSRMIGNYSLGMRQRLGIANALLGDPEVLVLDEPANGMDPEGIRWMRDLLHDFAARGGTVLLSSHLLGEVQATVDRLVVIGGGRILAENSLEALLQTDGVLVRSTDQPTLARALVSAGHPVDVTDDGALQVGATPEEVGRIALAAQAVLLELRDGGADVEDLYFRLTAAPTATPEKELADA